MSPATACVIFTRTLIVLLARNTIAWFRYLTAALSY